MVGWWVVEARPGQARLFFFFCLAVKVRPAPSPPCQQGCHMLSTSVLQCTLRLAVVASTVLSWGESFTACPTRPNSTSSPRRVPFPNALFFFFFFQAESVILMSDESDDTAVLLGSFELEQVLEEMPPGEPRPKARKRVWVWTLFRVYRRLGRGPGEASVGPVSVLHSGRGFIGASGVVSSVSFRFSVRNRQKVRVVVVCRKRVVPFPTRGTRWVLCV